MANKSLEMVVGAVAARLSKRYSIVDVKPQKRLESLGIRGSRSTDFKKSLYRTLSPEGARKFVEFADLEISLFIDNQASSFGASKDVSKETVIWPRRPRSAHRCAQQFARPLPRRARNTRSLKLPPRGN